jgi:hypothetical protein
MGEPRRRYLPHVSQTGRLTIADECAAFLSGDYLDYIREVGAIPRIPRAASSDVSQSAATTRGTTQRGRATAGPG